MDIPELMLLPPPRPRRAARRRRAAAQPPEVDHGALLTRLEGAWAELARAHRHLRALLDCVGDGVLGVDGDGTVTFANAAAGTLLGRDPADLIGAPASALAAGATRPDRPGYSAADTFRRADGVGMPVEWRCSALDDGSRVLVFRDARDRVAVARERLALRAWATATRGSGNAKARPRRVLFLEAEPLLRAAVGERLPAHGWEATLAADANAAVRVARQEAAAGRPFDVIVVDLTLVRSSDATAPSAGGALLAAHPDARILASCGCAHDPAMLDHTAHGFHAVLVKPYTIERLVGALDGDRDR